MILNQHIYQFIYFILLYPGYILFTQCTLHVFKQYDDYDNTVIHNYMSFLCIILCLITWLLCVYSNAGIITSSTQADKIINTNNALYDNNNQTTTIQHNNIQTTDNTQYCSKCNISKPPRTHHCKRCNKCIYKFDHHCIWINNCIGYYNIRHFILFLTVHTIALLYSTILHAYTFYYIITYNRLLYIEFKHNDGTIHKSNYSDINTYLIQQYTIMYLLMLLSIVVFVIMLYLLIQYIYYILHNDTSYDRHKRYDKLDQWYKQNNNATAEQYNKQADTLLYNIHNRGYYNNIVECIRHHEL